GVRGGGRGGPRSWTSRGAAARAPTTETTSMREDPMRDLIYDPLDPLQREDPYPAYAALRREAPVYQVPGLGIWAISRHADVVAVLRSPERFSSAAMAAAVRKPADLAPGDGPGDAPHPAATSRLGARPPAPAPPRRIMRP